MRGILAAMLLLLATPAAALDDPDQLVKGLYRRDTIPTEAKQLDWYFDADLARALKADSRTGEVGAIGFDYRYDAQDFEITALAFARTHRNSEATVTASFANFGKPTRVVYKLCVRRTGWKIAEVSAGDGGWSLRRMLQLPQHVSC